MVLDTIKMLKYENKNTRKKHARDFKRMGCRGVVAASGYRVVKV
jgi:hypothetical protein